ncbi:MAG TPA: hypothetical protein VGP93_06250, partial [Polyangiaceae bacterium]|jgi:hypothetical protein|nr:hypothetical protein [Polyangiaceae bacterium]
MRFRRKSVHCVLTVEAPACEDLMPELYRLLLSVHVQVVRVHAQVIADRVLHELDMLEFDGTPLEEERWRAVQTTVISYLGDRLLLDAPPAPLGALAERVTSLGA